jgi:hypothetical protein
MPASSPGIFDNPRPQKTQFSIVSSLHIMLRDTIKLNLGFSAIGSFVFVVYYFVY